MMIIFSIFLIIIVYLLLREDPACECKDNKSNDSCRHCGSHIDKDFNYCPKCKEQIRRKCGNCGNMIDVSWRNCPYC